MLEYLKEKYKKIILIGVYAINILLSILMIKNILSTYKLDYVLILPVCIALADLTISIIGIVKTVMNKYKKYVYYILTVALAILALIGGKIFTFNNGGFIAIQIIKMVISIPAMVYFYIIMKDLPKAKESEEKDVIKHKFFDWATLAINGLLNILVITIFVSPYYTSEGIDVILMDSLNNPATDILPSVVAFVFLVLWMISFINLSNVITLFACGSKDFAKKSKQNVLYIFGLSLAFSASGYVIALIQTLALDTQTVSNAYLPVIIVGVCAIIHSVFVARSGYVTEEEKAGNKNTLQKTLIIVFVLLLTATTFVALWVDIVNVNLLDGLGNSVLTIDINGKELLNNYSTMAKGFKLITFVLLIILFTSLGLFVGCLISYFSRSRYFKKVALVTVILNFIFVFVLGAFGTYYKIINELDQEVLNQLLEPYSFINISNLTPEVSSDSFYMTLADFIICAIILVLKPFSKFDADDLGVLKVKNLGGNPEGTPALPSKDNEAIDKKDENAENVLVNTDFDACPAFSEIDMSKPYIENNLNMIKQYSFMNPTLPDLVKFVVDYARESRLHLSYSYEDIATFIAGLGTTRLQILQGMSGTGKTSLPKIFMEAVLGNCEIVEVESSWKDKNELLGYYNEFSKIYTPKKFTQALYRAALNPEVMTFIVLDEMNLSRIEYYFSDFLSLMENEEDRREIKLLNVKLYNTYNNEKHSYLGLTNDHTIKIPKNVWFIGTANRDESTFEISDKVYDRAYTINFNKRAPKVKNFMYPIPQAYVSYDVFRYLVNAAVESFKFDLDDYDVVNQVEKILQPYNISFGNRVQKQIEEFVKIYCSCFNNPSDLVLEALEKVLLTKVVSKLEFKSIEDKDQLVRDFEKLKLYSCSEFISKLNEDF